MVKAAPDCASMDEVRAAIDTLDDQLVALLIERWSYVNRAWQLKDRPEDARVPWRIQQVIDNVTSKAEGSDLPPALVEAIWRQIIGWGIQFEEQKLTEKR